MTYATNYINFSTIKTIGNFRKRQHQTEIECDHSMGNDKSHEHQTEIECDHSMGNDKSHALPSVRCYIG